MDHSMHGMTGPSGTFEGHLLPGLLLLAWAILWIVREMRLAASPDPNMPMETGSLVPALKIATLFVAGWIEMPNRGWQPMDFVMGWHHITVYMGYALSGIVDLLHARGRLSHRATYGMFGMASLNAAFIFVGHGNHGGVESTAHLLLAGIWGLTGLFALMEAALYAPTLRWVRIGSMAALGAWMVVISWMLFHSGWELTDPIRVAWVFPAFSWTVLGTSAAVVVAAAVAYRARLGG